MTVLVELAKAVLAKAEAAEQALLERLILEDEADPYWTEGKP